MVQSADTAHYCTILLLVYDRYTCSCLGQTTLALVFFFGGGGGGLCSNLGQENRPRPKRFFCGVPRSLRDISYIVPQIRPPQALR